MAQTAQPLQGVRVLVPPARPERNPSLQMLQRRGAQTISFPTLEPSAPTNTHQLDRALDDLTSWDWLVIAGSNSASNVLRRAEQLGVGSDALAGVRIAAIGAGAQRVLGQAGVSVAAKPRRHVAADVAGELGELAAKRVLLVGVSGASEALPATLRDRGADVWQADGYVMTVRTQEHQRDLFAPPVDVLALVSPTAVRFFLTGLEQLALGPAEVLPKCTVVAVGAVTAEVARQRRIPVDRVASGRIAPMVREIVALYEGA